MEKFILDITDVDKEKYPALEYFPDKVRCEYGSHKMDFDINMDDLEPNIDKIHEYYQKQGFVDMDYFKNPIGFNIGSMPVGAKLERIE